MNVNDLPHPHILPTSLPRVSSSSHPNPPPASSSALQQKFGFQYFFNHWVGMFHGVAPGTFTWSHVYNHHKYDNDERDVYSTAFRPRDSFSAWVRYLPEWFAYASNISR